MAYDEALADRVLKALSDQPDLVEKKMFGGVGYLLRGNMACGVHKDKLIVRVGPAGYEEAISRPHTAPFDITGRAMKGWVMVEVIARVLALEPEIILLDEPTSGLDPISTGKVEGSLQMLKEEYTIVLVPHSIQQAARTADFAAFMLDGELIEYAEGKQLFTNPKDQRTEDYVEGRFG